MGGERRGWAAWRAAAHRICQVLRIELGQARARLGADATHQLVRLDAQLAKPPQRVGQRLQKVEWCGVAWGWL